ncbi:phosphatidylinositol 3-kinase 92E [Arctopsyche grandis]|uniref:phosphatidylinositol 3-kinase 92E n=1 Tax=Arctopsyche grandis TaxID=121162 RepID=UPI00406D8700
MAPVPKTFAWDFWGKPPPECVELTCLLPTGVTVPLVVNRSCSLHDIKEDLWEKAAKYPLHGMLLDMSLYYLQYISYIAGYDIVDDENKRLLDIKPRFGLIKVVEKQKENDELLNNQISRLIGKGLKEFDALKITEVNDFRIKMRHLAKESRKYSTWAEHLCHQYPPRLANSPNLPQTLANRIRDYHFVLSSKFVNTDTTYTFNVSYTITPQLLLKTILAKRANAMNTRGEQPSDFILKICGREEYLFGDYPLIQFIYIQETLSRDGVPTVITLPIKSVPLDGRHVYKTPQMDNFISQPCSSTLRKKGKTISSWDIRDRYSCRILAVCKLNTDTNRNVEVVVQASLYHSGKSLCEIQSTAEYAVAKDIEITTIREELTFPIEVYNVPCLARLCFVIYEVTKTAKGLKSRRMKEGSRELYVNPLAWVNMSVFDYKNQLKTGGMTLYMWTYAEDMQNEDLLNPLGTIVPNPNTDQCAVLTIECSNYSQEHTILFPPDDVVLNFAGKGKDSNTSPSFRNINIKAFSTEYLMQLRQVAEKEPVYEMHEQERRSLWALREDFRTQHPTFLPKLLLCVDWNERQEAADAAALVSDWPLLSSAHALELLDYAYADRFVRRFAVSCLWNISDEDLSLYLLQLVQALKHETFYMCDLMEFLLRRALANRNIGHFLFWHLRSEMQVPSVSIRFGLILEAYCRGCEDHLDSLTRQTGSLGILINASEVVRDRRDIKNARTALTEHLSDFHCQETLSTFTSTLDPSVKCKKVKVEKCRVMDSKMRPLWLVFENQDSYGSDISIILKNGDDLRQDMLTLQMIKIMDRLWKNEGYDFRMNPYGCISMDHRVGMIEVVLNAETIANIQKEKGLFSATSPFKKGLLLSWLRDHNPTEETLGKAIEEFTLSCAGYCVATYVLGVADRHSDNIMVKKTGQLFHIDFGHILGHFKEKFGFRRERVPFVLTHDFVNVINKGQKDAKKALEFQIFQTHCETAFMILRKHGYLFLSLFAMMISTGLPELSSEKDLVYLRETLVLDLTEAEALSHFRSKFDEALSNSWKTSLNWASHNMAKNNKQ